METQDKMLKDQDYATAARELGVEEARIRAVCRVESAGDGFLADGRPKILFEGHIFWRELKARGLDPVVLAKDRACPDILYEKWTKAFYRGGAGEYERLERACAIQREAALSAASWGAFQIMGNNCKACGCAGVEDFVKSQETAAGQLAAFCAFIRSNKKMYAALSAPLPDWVTFARCYNGPAYAQNQYDKKLAEAYAKAGGKA